jgi:hypothetical protein
MIVDQYSDFIERKGIFGQDVTGGKESEKRKEQRGYNTQE